jgi:hypothetical protein
MTTHPLALASNRSKKKRKNHLIPSATCSPPYHLAVATPRCPVRNADATLPCCCRAPHLASLACPHCDHFSPPSRRERFLALCCRTRWCWGCSLRLSRAARSAEPRPVLVALVEVVCARPGASAPTIQTKPTAGGGGACAPLLAVGSGPSSWNRPTTIFPSPMLYMYISINLDVSNVHYNCSILMLQK